MTSLKFSYSLKLFKESLKQSRHIMIMHTILLLLATILPAQIAIADLAERIKEYYPTILNMRADYTYLISGFSFFAMVVMHLASFSTMSFSYLYNSRSAIFYGTLPYKKSTMFFARYLSGIVSLLIPVIICYIVNAFVFLGHNELLGGVDFIWYTKNWMFVALTYLLIYSLCTFAANLSCNTFAQLIIMGAMILLYPSVVFILAETVNVMMNTYMIDYSLNAFYIFPPFAAVFRASDINYTITSIIAIIESIALTGLGYVGYIKRRTEKVNNFFAFSSVNSVLKYFITFLCSAGFGLLLAAVNRSNKEIAYIGYIVFGFVGYAIIQMIFEKTPKAMFKNMKGLIIFLVIISLLASIPVFDILKLEEKMPNPEKFEKVAITKIDSVSSYWNGDTEIVLTQPESIKAACKLYAKGEQKLQNYGRRFRLTPNNSIFTRRTYALSIEDITEFLKSVYNNNDYKNAIKIQDDAFDRFGTDLRYRYYINKNAFYGRKEVADKEIINKLVETFNSDLINTKAEDIDFTEAYAFINIPGGDVAVFKEYKNTVELLEKEFVVKPDYASFKKIELKSSTKDEVEHTITDPEKIKFVLDNVTDYYHDASYSKGYHICYETIDGQKVNHIAWVTESFLKKHNIL
ncbi:MAG: hypothetical protein IJE46_00495 [Clostridia bacterium]|nr:hypothetical protein [Clostridia bacterium]